MNAMEVENLKDVFKCFICMEKLKDARLCPHCSKFCCFQCIRRWLTEQRPQCPHCRCSLQVSHLVKCRWAEEVTSTLEGLGPEAAAAASSSRAPLPSGRLLEPDRCREHQEKLSVFCCSCEACICHHCALWGGFHAGHTLKPLEDEYRERAKQISEEVKKLRHRLCHLLSSIHKLEGNIEEVRESKEERVEETRLAMEMMVSRLDSQMKSRLVSLTGQKRTIGMEVEMVEGVLGEVETQLATAPHSHLIAASPELFRMLSQIQRTPPAPPLHISPQFVSEVVPEYEGRSLLLANYSELRRKAEPVYSQPLHLNGLQWRLKVYPDGNGVVKGGHLSVFLELSKGPPGQARYEYRVEMLHQASNGDPDRSVIREFGSEFEVGECWGYNRFFKLDCLLSEGYLDSATDSLRLHFKVRPPSYFQMAKDLQWCLAEREREGTATTATSGQSSLDLGASSPSSPAKATAAALGNALFRPAKTVTDRPSASSFVALSPGPLPSPPSEKDIDEEGGPRPQTNDVDEERRLEESQRSWQSNLRGLGMSESLGGGGAPPVPRHAVAAMSELFASSLPPADPETERDSDFGGRAGLDMAQASLAAAAQPRYIPTPQHMAAAEVTTAAVTGPSSLPAPWVNALAGAGGSPGPSRQLPSLASLAVSLSESPRRGAGRTGISRSSSLDALCTPDPGTPTQ